MEKRRSICNTFFNLVLLKSCQSRKKKTQAWAHQLRRMNEEEKLRIGEQKGGRERKDESGLC
jgi:hypothetical protein